MRYRLLMLLTPALLAGCGEREGSPGCGISSLAAAVMILDQFSVPGQTMSAAPRALPEEIAVRVAAGPVVRGLIGRVDSLLVIGVDEPLPATPVPGFGVLIASLDGTPRGVMLFEGLPIADAPHLGTVEIGDRSIPLLGLRAEDRRIEDARCPLFPAPTSR
jgi:hypothetical protein